MGAKAHKRGPGRSGPKAKRPDGRARRLREHEGARKGSRQSSASWQKAAEIKREKGIWWMPWRMEAMKDVARCEKPWGGASTL